MSTTIQISNKAKRLLLKDKGDRTYDEVIIDMYEQTRGKRTSGFGIIPGLKWSKEDRGTSRYD